VVGRFLLSGFFRYYSVFILLSLSGFAHAIGRYDTPPSRCAIETLHSLRSDTAAVRARLVASELDMDRILAHLKVLTGVEPIYESYRLRDRFTAMHRQLVRNYVMGYLKKLGYEDIFFEAFTSGLNFWVETTGTEFPDEVFEITAHYDTADKEVPGADDNGSGLGVLLEMARIFQIHKPKRTVRIVFMDLEEKGFKGSSFHATALEKEFGVNGPRKFLGSLVIDTIGYNPVGERASEERVVLEVGEVGDYGPRKKRKKKKKSNSIIATESLGREVAYAAAIECAQGFCYQFLRFADEESKREGLKLTVETVTAKGDTGDHGAYWKVNRPAFLLAAPFEQDYVNPGYHTPDDRLDNMNWPYYTRVSHFAVEMTASVIGAVPNETIVHRTAELAVSERGEIRREENHIAKLESEPPPDLYLVARKKLRELPAGNVAVVVKSDLRQCDVLYPGGGNVYVIGEEDIELLLEFAEQRGVAILLKKTSGVVSLSELEALKRWNETRAASDLPAEFGYF
jgi:acetylornithine deacetylase/succinyl-diaminopimelate desuccinylase-like protein